MSSIKITTVDFAVLPAALLPKAKAQLRASDYTYDDAWITDAIARAISWFERFTGITVNPTSYEWTPDASDFVTPRSGIDPAVVPFSPVNDGWTATADSGDVTGDYKMTSNAVHGVAIYSLEGNHVAGLVLAIDSGYAAADLPPGIVDAIMRYTAHLFENREILVPGSEAATPGWLNDVLATYWMPRV